MQQFAQKGRRPRYEWNGLIGLSAISSSIGVGRTALSNHLMASNGDIHVAIESILNAKRGQKPKYIYNNIKGLKNIAASIGTSRNTLLSYTKLLDGDVAAAVEVIKARGVENQSVGRPVIYKWHDEKGVCSIARYLGIKHSTLHYYLRMYDRDLDKAITHIEAKKALRVDDLRYRSSV